MSLGANLSSGYTDILTDKTIRGGPISKVIDACEKCNSGIGLNVQPVASYSSMILLKQTCATRLTPAEFALYPKASVPSSVRTQSLSAPACSNIDDRFSKYIRYQPAAPCLPLSPTANMAGISLPSTRQCN